MTAVFDQFLTWYSTQVLLPYLHMDKLAQARHSQCKVFNNLLSRIYLIEEFITGKMHLETSL